MVFLPANNLKGTLNGTLGKLSRLRKLHLFQNSLCGEIPAEVALLTNLNTLWLYDNNLDGPLPSTFFDTGMLSSLKQLDLSKNKLSGSLATFDCAAFCGLQSLLLHNNKFEGAIPNIETCTSLRILNLRKNQFSELPKGLGKGLAQLEKLNRLYLSSNFNIEMDIPKRLKPRLDCSSRGEVEAFCQDLTKLGY